MGKPKTFYKAESRPTTGQLIDQAVEAVHLTDTCNSFTHRVFGAGGVETAVPEGIDSSRGSMYLKLGTENHSNFARLLDGMISGGRDVYDEANRLGLYVVAPDKVGQPEPKDVEAVGVVLGKQSEKGTELLETREFSPKDIGGLVIAEATEFGNLALDLTSLAHQARRYSRQNMFGLVMDGFDTVTYGF
jgi:hypothetical protein